MDEDLAGPGAAAKEEAARQLVALGLTLAAVPVLVWLERKASEPDAFREWRMRAAKGGERLCATLAGFFWRRAEDWRRAYENERG